MAYDETHADLLREDLGFRDGLSEKKMFGGLCFLLYGHMLCGTSQNRALFRVGKDLEPEALSHPYVTPMTHGGRRMGGFVYLAEDGLTDPQSRGTLMAMALQFVGSLPAKVQ